MIDQLKLLVRLYIDPAGAMGAILDRGSLLFATLSVLGLTLLLKTGIGYDPQFAFYTPLLMLAAFYVPGILILATLIARVGGFAVVFQRDYSSLLTCAAMAWTAAMAPLAIATHLTPSVYMVILGLCALYFAFLVFFAIRTVLSTDTGPTIAIVCLSWTSIVVAFLLWGPLGFAMRFLASPFFLFYLIYYLRAEFSGFGSGLRQRQSHRRMLEAAAINPHDGEAQYQLGLIHQQRHQYTEAIRRFQAAVTIDNTETDAHYQLGRIAREQGRLEEALTRFETVLRQDEKHSLSEIHRDLGGTYLDLGRLDDARRELVIYEGRRAFDPEGLYYFGQLLERTGDPSGARDMYARAVEADRTAPRYRRRFTAKWSRLAQKQLRKLPR